MLKNIRPKGRGIKPQGIKASAIGTFLLVCLASMSTAFSAVKASLEQTTVFEGDPITLIIETDQNTNAKPDLSILEKDFQILGTSTSSQINVFNGQRFYQKTWKISLQTKRKNEVTIPKIIIGHEKTDSLKLAIKKLPPEVKAETSKHVFVESSVDTKGNTTYVQQQIPYTVKLYYDSTMRTAEFQSPSIDNAVMEQLGDDRRYQIERKGRLFTVVEKHFVISPEKSGTLHIPPSVITGQMSLPVAREQAQQQQERGGGNRDFLNRFFRDFQQDPFPDDFFPRRRQGPSKPFSIETESIDVTVLPVPEKFTGSTWLPAEQLIVKDSWTRSPPELKVGEPITRIITLQAKGLAGSQIPDIKIPKLDGFKIYPETPHSETRTDGNTVFGIQRLKLSYIPNKSGAATVPAIKFDWWDVKNKKQKTATLPAWNLNVAKGEFAEESLSSGTETQSNSRELQEGLKDDKPSPMSEEENKSSFQLFSWVSLVWMIMTLIFGILLFWLAKKYLRNTHNKHDKQDIGLILRTLQNACLENDPKASADNLIKFVQIDWDDDSIQNLRSIINKTETGSEVILELERSLYAHDGKSWNGEALQQLIEKGIVNKDEPNRYSQSKDDLKPLYPI